MASLRADHMQIKCIVFFWQLIAASYGRVLVAAKMSASSQCTVRGQYLLLVQVGMQYRTELNPHELGLLNTWRDPDEVAPTVPPDVVPPKEIVQLTFGILIKNFYGIDFVDGSFTTDSIVVATWKDKYNDLLIPKGEKQLRLGPHEAEGEIWLPDIQVSNIAQDGIHVISTSFLIEPGGITTKVERALLTTKATFEYSSFPFDEQVLEIRLASATYMDDQVALTPTLNESLWGVATDAIASWNLVNSSIYTIVESDGLLSKSRGVLRLIVTRPTDQFVSSVFVPSVMMVGMSWSSVWLPLEAGFAMPRVALNAFALLAQVTLATHVESMTPQGKLTWLDEYVTSCFILQFILLIQNISVLTMKFRLSEDKYAERMSFHLRLIFPFVWALTLAAVWVSPYKVPLFIGITTLIYILYHCWDYHRFREDSEEAKEEQPLGISS